MSKPSHKFLNLEETSVAYSIGVLPLASALCAIFCPCSSVPVKKNVLEPVNLECRANISAIIVV